jgi:hypothetical protein
MILFINIFTIKLMRGVAVFFDEFGRHCKAKKGFPRMGKWCLFSGNEFHRYMRPVGRR